MREIEKSLLDFLVSVFLLILFSPLILLLLLTVRLDSRGRALIKLKRVGRGGRIFYLYKIRTMYPGTQQVTPLGRFLRELGLDEIPQLFNVIRREMSLVGPRPEIPQIVEGYTEQERVRLKVLPGITGPWQISPWREQPIHAHLEYDLDYIEKGSLFYDLALYLKTLSWLLRKLKKVRR